MKEKRSSYSRESNPTLKQSHKFITPSIFVNDLVNHVRQFFIFAVVQFYLFILILCLPNSTYFVFVCLSGCQFLHEVHELLVGAT